jgi:hypothetical protein
MKEVLRTELAKKGIFFIDAQYLHQQPHQQTFESTLLILSKIGSLFYDPGDLHVMIDITLHVYRETHRWTITVRAAADRTSIAISQILYQLLHRASISESVGGIFGTLQIG